MYNFIIRDFARAFSLVIVLTSLFVASLLVMLPDESVPFEYSILRYHALMQIELLSYSLDVWWLYPSALAKYMLAYIWAYWLPFTFLFRPKVGWENFHWFACTWKPSALFFVMLILATAFLRITGRKAPVQQAALLALVGFGFVMSIVFPIVALKFFSANLFVLVKVDSIFFFFVYFVYSAVVLAPISSLISSVSSKL